MSADRITWRWDGDSLWPEGNWGRARANDTLVVGQSYRLSAEDLRSWVSHKHEFAWLNEAFLSIHERYADAPFARSPEHLRKYALIKSGFAKSQVYPCKFKAEARRMAATIEDLDEFAIVVVDGRTVTRWTAQSQSMKAMGGKDFQRSKTAVLEFVATLLEVAPQTLEAQASGFIEEREPA